MDSFDRYHPRFRPISSEGTSIIFPIGDILPIGLSLFSEIIMVTYRRLGFLQVIWSPKIMDCAHAAYCWITDVICLA